MFSFFSSWFGPKRNTKKTSKHLKTAVLRTMPWMEPLEDRTTPAVASLVGDVLTVDFQVVDSTAEAVVATNDGTSINLSGDVSGSLLSFAVGDVNQIVLTDSGTGTAQSMKFEGTFAFALAGGFSSTGIETVEVNQAISTAASNLQIQANHSIQISANLITTTGDIILASNGGSSGDNLGLVISGANTLVSTAGGNIALSGSGSGTTNNLHGVVVDTGAKITAGDDGTSFGSISITGVGSSAATGNYNFGVWLDGTNTSVQSTGGNIFISGTGGGTAGSAGNFGVVVSSGAIVSAGGMGSVEVTGNGSALVTGGGNMGVRVEGVGSRIATAGGSITVNGTGGGTGSGGSNHGILVADGGVIQSGGTGTVLITGVASASDTGSNNYGVLVSTNYARIISSGGSIQVEGTGGGSGAGNYNYGVKVASTGNITSGANGHVTVTGTGGGGATSTIGFNIGVMVLDSGMMLAQGTGALAVSGSGGANSGGDYNHGVLIGYSSLVQAGLGGLSIAGSKANGDTSFGIGLDQNVSATTGNTGGSVSLSANGILIGSGAMVFTTGTVTVASLANISGTGDLIANALSISAGTGMDVDTQVAALMDVSTTSGDIILEQTGNLELPAIVAPGNLTVTASGSISQQSATSLAVTGNTTITAGTTIVLESPGNDFSGAVALNNQGANNISIVDANALLFSASHMGSGNLSVIANGISQNGSIVQEAGAGAVNLNAGTGTLSLVQAGNDFTGAVSLGNSGSEAIQILDSNQILLDQIVSGGGFSAQALGAITSTLAGSIHAAGAVSLTGAAIGTNDGPMVFANASGVSAETTSNGNIVLKGLANPIGLTLVNAGTGTLTLKAGEFVSRGAEVIQNDTSVNLDGGAWSLDNQLETVAGIQGSTNLQLGSGGLTVTGSTADTFSGVISGAGFFTRAGTGSTNFVGVHTHTGGTIITSGVLILAANQTGNFIVEGGTLEGPASIGNLEVRSGAVAPSGITSKNLTLSATATLPLHIHGSSSDHLTALGTVDLANATLDLGAITQALPGTELILINNDGNDAVVGTFQGMDNLQLVNIQGVNYRLRYQGGDGNDVSITRARPESITVGNIQTTTGSGMEIHLAEAGITATITPFAGFFGDIRVNSNADFNGDGVNEVVVSAGPGGGPRVTVFNGNTGTTLVDFFAYDVTFTGGIFVATGDVTGDGVADLVTGAGAGGGPHVMVWDGVSLARQAPVAQASFFAFATQFLGGVTVATGDLGGDGVHEIITGAGAGGGPQVNVYSGGSLQLISAFFAFELDFVGGVHVATGDLDGDLRDEIITGQGAGGNARVHYFSGHDFQRLGGFLAYGQGFSGSVRVGAADYYGTGVQNLITGAGEGGGPQVNVYDANNHLLDAFFGGNDPSHTRGVYVS